mgnify:CR=1 FL=1
MLLFLAWLMVGPGCARDRFELGGARERLPETRAVLMSTNWRKQARIRALPKLSLRGREADYLLPSYRGFRVKSHKPAYDGAYRELILESHDATAPGGRKKAVLLEYTPPGGNLLPLKVGEKIQIRLFRPDRRKRSTSPEEDPVRDDSRRHFVIAGTRQQGMPDLSMGGLRGWTLAIRDVDQRLIAVLFSGRYHPLSDEDHKLDFTMVAPLKVRPSRRVVYEEAMVLPSLCRPILSHQAVELRTGKAGQTLRAIPGTYVDFTVGNTGFRWVLLDASRAISGSCGPDVPAHVSFAILRRGPARGRASATGVHGLRLAVGR